MAENEELTVVVKADTTFLKGLVEKLASTIKANEELKRYVEEQLTEQAIVTA